MGPQKNRKEVMKFMALDMEKILSEYLKPIDTNWQPSDLLPDASSENFFQEVKELQEVCKELPYDYIAVLIGDTITEEALPTYETWLSAMEGLDPVNDREGWAKWMRWWTAEENRHGDLLNKYLYLSGRVNMREMETSTQWLISDGFDPQTGNDPYKNFVYTTFQEMATNVSHRRTASQAKLYGNKQLSKICGVIASDELRHYKAYKSFVSRIFEIDTSEMMLAFHEMMKRKIVMPAHFLRETGFKIGSTFSHFSDAAQRLGVYTTHDYIDILESLIVDWKIEELRGLTDKAEEARDYVLSLPARFKRLADRTKIPTLEYEFKWITR